jgi:glucose 1-dehydrogenase
MLIRKKQQAAQASGLPTDVGELDQVKALADHAAQTFGKIDIWVNNAGIGGVYGPTASIDPELFERVIRTNIFGEYYGSLVALQHFLAQGNSGKLINLLGRGDRQPVKFQSAYASSKTWVRNFTLALAKEYAETGIGIYALIPGLMNTALLRKIEIVKGYEKKLKSLSVVIRLWAKPLDVPA